MTLLGKYECKMLIRNFFSGINYVMTEHYYSESFKA